MAAAATTITGNVPMGPRVCFGQGRERKIKRISPILSILHGYLSRFSNQKKKRVSLGTFSECRHCPDSEILAALTLSQETLGWGGGAVG